MTKMQKTLIGVQIML